MNSFVKVTITTLVIIILIGFYEKNRRKELFQNFKDNKPVLCEGVIVQKSLGWRIHHNRFFTNGKVMKTIVFCESMK